MTFKKGDRIRASDTGWTATVDGTSFNSIYQEDEVYVTWDHMQDKGSCGYAISQILGSWVKENSVPQAMYVGIDFAYADVNDRSVELEIKKPCQHKWVEVGFTHTKTVCYHCDAEKA
jgi:hypothetical protein